MSTSHVISSKTFGSEYGSKYAGILKVSKAKLFLKDLYSLFSYIELTAPSYQYLHSLISFIRILQFFGSCLNLNNMNLWPKDTIEGKTINYLSIAFQFIPSHYLEESRRIFAILFLVLTGVMAIVISISAIYYKKYANIPNVLDIVISLFFASFAHIMHVVICMLVFELYGQYAFIGRVPIWAEYLMTVMCLLLIFILFFLILKITGRTLSFKSQSLMTVSINTWNFQFFMPLLLTAISSFVARAKGKGIFVGFMVVEGLLYLACAILPFYKGGFVDHVIQNLVLTSDIVGCLICFIMAILFALNKPMKLVILFSLAGVYVLVLFIVHILLNRYKIKILFQLDMICDDPENFHCFKTQNSCLNAMKIGYEFGHPICVDSRLCKLAVDKWPYSQELWFAYAKYIAIFPEENQALEMIYMALYSNKIKGNLAKIIKEQCISICKMREANLSVSLKAKINKITRSINSSKHKLRHVWDIVLQGNMNEVESSTKRSIISIQQVDTEFKRLVREYPNNRFVTRPYSHFLADVKADFQGSVDMVNKTRLLQRGIIVNEDHFHMYGLKTFERLPQKLQNNKSIHEQLATESAISSFMNDNDFDDNVTVMNESSQLLLDKINKLSIPATSSSIGIRYVILLLLFLLPCVAVIVALKYFTEDLATPMPYIQLVVQLRNRALQIASFSLRWIFIQLGYLPEIKHQDGIPPPPSLGGTWDLTEQLFFILGTATSISQNIGVYRQFKSSNKNMNEVSKYIFTSVINYTFFTNLKNFSEYKTSCNGIVVDYVVQISAAMRMDVEKYDMANMGIVLNLVKNTLPLLTGLRNSLNEFTLYYTGINDQFIALTQIIQIACIVAICVIYISSLILQIWWIQSNKKTAYLCLMALPKNTISQLAESLRIIKKDGGSNQSTSENNTEISKQEENIQKVFSSGGVSSVKYGDVFPIILSNFILMALEIISIILLAQCTTDETLNLVKSAPHLGNIGDSYTSALASLYYLDLLTLCGTPAEIGVFSEIQYKGMVKEFMNMGQKSYQAVEFGDTKVRPFAGFDDGLKNSEKVLICTDRLSYATSYLDVTRCLNSDMIYTSFEMFLQYIQSSADVKHVHLSANISYISDMWSLLTFPVFEGFFKPMLNSIIDTISGTVENTFNVMLNAMIPIIVVSLFIEVIATIWIKHIEKHIKEVLKLLLHCSPEIVMQNSKIMKVLSGNFSNTRYDSATRDEVFFDKILENLPETILYADPNSGSIECINKQGRKLICGDDESKKVIGENINNFMSQFEGDIEELIKTTSVTTKEILMRRKEETLFFQATASISNQKLVIALRDTTGAVRYQTLIKEERAKSDQLLSSILPPSLVRRVQMGETNISFAVQSASIVFMDIVSFTPWCGALPADKVMSTLNLLFKKNDMLVAKYPTMMKIKCIGDCYMAAGGVFAESNQPTEHAKEVVNFGLDALDAVHELNKELNEKLQIRVGINSGGPIVAGVLGIGKPTFEIIGPTINMAQQMEHHGVPMQVHISRNVYELVYGDIFEIKERGSIEVKGGSVLTYLVTGRK